MHGLIITALDTSEVHDVWCSGAAFEILFGWVVGFSLASLFMQCFVVVVAVIFSYKTTLI
jgi:hypothetical protein